MILKLTKHDSSEFHFFPSISIRETEEKIETAQRALI